MQATGSKILILMKQVDVSYFMPVSFAYIVRGMENVTHVWQSLYNDTQPVLNLTDNYYYYPPPQPPPRYPNLPLQFIHVIASLDEYGLPTLFTLGAVFNIFAVAVAIRTELRKVATFLYIVCLCIIDTVYLTTKMVHWGSVRVYNINNIAGICQIVYYCHFLTTFLEWWMVVCLLLERVAMLFRPVFARKMCNPFRTKCALITICIFAIVAHLYHTWTSAVLWVHGRPMCTIIPENAKDVMLLRKIDSIFSMILPSFAITILVLLALFKITCCKKIKQRNIRSFSSASVRSRRTSHVHIQTENCYIMSFDPKKFTETRRLSVYAICISLLFLLLCFPHDFIKTCLTLENGSILSTIEERLIFQLLSQVYTLNFAYKGVFCFVFIPEFRKATVALIKRLFCCSRRQDFLQCKHTVV